MKKLFLFTCIFLTLLLIACNKREDEPFASSKQIRNMIYKEEEIASDFGNDEPVTKEEFCQIIAKAIDDLDYLRSSYISIEEEICQGKDSDFYSFFFNGQEPVTVQARMASLMRLQIDKTRDGKEHLYYIYDGEGSLSRYALLLSDYSQIREAYRESCLKGLHYGYMDLEYSKDRHEIYFKPNDFVSLDYASRVINKVFLGRGFPADSIMVNHWEDERPICMLISEVPCLIGAKEIERHLSDGDRVFFTFSLDESSFCLWYKTEDFGMFTLPLYFLKGESVVVEVSYLDEVNIESKLRISSFLFPIEHRQLYFDVVNETISKRESSTCFFGEIGAKVFICDNNMYLIMLEGVQA